MRGLATLLRLARRRSEDHRARLAAAVLEHQVAVAELATHDAAALQEDASAGREVSAQADWAAWMVVAARRRQGLAAADQALLADEAAARETMRDGIAETRRLELALEAALREEQAKVRRRQQAAAEDIELRRPKG